MREIAEKDIAKTELGLVESIDRVFTGARYVRSVVVPGQGSYLDKLPSEIFVSLREVTGAPATFDAKYKHALVATPVVGASPGALRLGGIECIEWSGTGKALVIMRDPEYLCSTWLAFVPVESIIRLSLQG